MFVLFRQGTGWKPVADQRVARCDCRLRTRNEACSGLREFLSDMSIANFPTLNLTVPIVDCIGPHGRLPIRQRSIHWRRVACFL